MNNLSVSKADSAAVGVDPAAAQVWDSCLEILRDSIKASTFKTWFEPLSPTALDGSLLTVEVPSTYFYEWLETHYFDEIQAALRQTLGDQARLQYAVRIRQTEAVRVGHDVEDRYETGRRDGVVQPISRQGTGPAGDGSVTPASPGSAVHGAGPVRIGYMNDARDRGAGDILPSSLNPKFTFENFIRGDGNQFARAAALNVANNPGETAFNPLVLYGGVGLGKTHLIQAVGNAILSGNSGKRVYYVSSEKFTIDFVDAIEKNRTIEFSNFYRSMDVLIVDDIQFFSGKERTQDTFFHTFNTLYQLKKQIILSSDRPPKELVGLDERLISRFQCGLTVDIQPPDLETRIAILRKKAEGDHIDLPQDVIDYIASNVKSNIRELEGCYIGLIARHTLEQRPIDVPLAQTVLRNVIAGEKKDLTVEQIQKVVADHFTISENSLRAKTRKQEIVLPRQVAMYLSKMYTRASLKTIGLHFGGRDHSTIIHACKTIEAAMGSDDGLKNHVNELEKQLTWLSR